jgi:hypothetical protein
MRVMSSRRPAAVVAELSTKMDGRITSLETRVTVLEGELHAQASP